MSEIKPSHKGLLHKELGIPEDQKISVAQLLTAKERARKTGNKKLMKQAVYAENIRK